MRRQLEPPPADGYSRRRPTIGEVYRALLFPCLLYIALQLAGLVLHIAGAEPRGTNRLGTPATVCSALAWLVLAVGLARLFVKLRLRRGH
ncbi:MAG TPA: hypothetical protein VMF57_01970 [Solirubrobacteraceae bacterium]|nr:hypothetical protein [Solirubrobacteraceae bacterium]